MVPKVSSRHAGLPARQSTATWRRRELDLLERGLGDRGVFLAGYRCTIKGTHTGSSWNRRASSRMEPDVRSAEGFLLGLRKLRYDGPQPSGDGKSPMRWGNPWSAGGRLDTAESASWTRWQSRMSSMANPVECPAPASAAYRTRTSRSPSSRYPR